MKFMIVNTDYDPFIAQLYRDNPGLDRCDYAQQHTVRMASQFGTADFYSHHLKKLGHEAWDVIANIEPMQRQWAGQHDVTVHKGYQWTLRLRRHVVPWAQRRPTRRWLYDVLEAQVKHYRPDVFYCMALETVDSEFLRRVRPYYGIAVGQHAAPLPQGDVRGYDLILSSLANQVEHFQRMGVSSQLLHLGFEPRVLDRLTAGPKRYDIAFVGGLAGPHAQGTRILEALCRRFNVKVWGYGRHALADDSPIIARFGGPLWGTAMYQALRDARLVFNRHIDAAGPYANNMRLYEATGVGTCLLTDARRNLSRLFEPGRHVVAYRGEQDCIELAEHYLAHDEQREAIARAGQQRTLSQHTWGHRMDELIDTLSGYLRAAAA